MQVALRRLLGKRPVLVTILNSGMQNINAAPAHAVSVKSSRPISMRRISEVPAPIS